MQPGWSHRLQEWKARPTEQKEPASGWAPDPRRGCRRRSRERSPYPTGSADPASNLPHRPRGVVPALLDRQRRATRQGVAVLGGGQVAASVLATLQRHATILFRTHGGLRRDGLRNAIKLSVDIRERSRRLALLSRGQVLVQSSLSGVHGCLRVDHGLLAIRRGCGVGGCGRRGRGSSGSGLCRKARHVDGEGGAGKGPTLFCQEFSRCASPPPARPET